MSLNHLPIVDGPVSFSTPGWLQILITENHGKPPIPVALPEVFSPLADDSLEITASSEVLPTI